MNELDIAALVAITEGICTEESSLSAPMYIGTESKPGSIAKAVRQAKADYRLSNLSLSHLYSAKKIAYNASSHSFYFPSSRRDEVVNEEIANALASYYADYKVREAKERGVEFDESENRAKDDLFLACYPYAKKFVSERDNPSSNELESAIYRDAKAKALFPFIEIVELNNTKAIDLVADCIAAYTGKNDVEPESAPDNNDLSSNDEVFAPCNASSLTASVSEAIVTDMVRLIVLQAMILLPAALFTPLLVLPLPSAIAIALLLLYAGNSTVGRLVPLKTATLWTRRVRP